MWGHRVVIARTLENSDRGCCECWNLTNYKQLNLQNRLNNRLKRLQKRTGFVFLRNFFLDFVAICLLPNFSNQLEEAFFDINAGFS